jgi:MFS family permease
LSAEIFAQTRHGETWRVERVAAAAALLGVGWGANQFAPMLLVYHARLGIGTGTLEAMFGLYALGLIPGLLIGGPLSDRVGRRAVVFPAAGLSVLATAILMLGGHATLALFGGRLLAGVASGAVFSAATTWLRESSLALGEGASAAGRTAVAMTAGFGLGPLIAGALAQWAPSPTVLPYLPHALMMIPVLGLLWRAKSPAIPRSAPNAAARSPRLRVLGQPRFRGVVVPLAPWVFAAPTIAFALLPGVIAVARHPDGIVVAAGVTALTALAGVLVQPIARHLDRSLEGAAGITGLFVLAAGLGLAVATVESGQSSLLVLCALILGSAYGLCLVAGLTEVQHLAGERELARATSVYYALTYLGFAAPYAFTSARALSGYPVLFAAAAVLALATAATITVQGARHPRSAPGRQHAA